MVCWGPGSLERNLAQLLHRRRLEAERHDLVGEVLNSRLGATLGDVSQFLAGRTDDRRIAELVHGLALVELASAESSEPVGKPFLPTTAYAFLKPLFTPESLLRRIRWNGGTWLTKEQRLLLPPEIPSRLSSGEIEAALRLAWGRYRALGKKLPGGKPPSAGGLRGERLLAALIIPLRRSELARLLRQFDLETLETSGPGSVNKLTEEVGYGA